eukprot:NODE_299_length_10456_cov_1.003669.p2 type:complete len:313 gc:universal NODE_299_length_10456_cov_1.003669:7366-8304(+)
MYALLLTFLTLLVSISIDCPIVIQLALDLEIKFTNTEYFMQYEKDCCLGKGVICENERVVELHWDFPYDYSKVTYPIVTFPPHLRVLDFSNCYKSMIIKQLPDTLKVFNSYQAEFVYLKVSTFPNLTYFNLAQFGPSGIPTLPRLPDSLQYIEIESYPYDILPLNATNLKEIHHFSLNEEQPRPFPNLLETIEIVELLYLNLVGPILMHFPNVQYFVLSGKNLNGNLTITSPNITNLNIGDAGFNRLFVKYPQKITICSVDQLRLEPDNQVDVGPLQSRGCKIFQNSPIHRLPQSQSIYASTEFSSSSTKFL